MARSDRTPPRKFGNDKFGEGKAGDGRFASSRSGAAAKPGGGARTERPVHAKPPAAPGDRPRAAGNRLHLPHQGNRDEAPRTPAARPQAAAPAMAVRTQAGGSAPATADTPRGTLWLYGAHAVAAALGNPARRLRRLVLTEEAEVALAGRVRQPWPLAPERIERARLDQMLGRDVVHQGIALLADPLAPPAMGAALERPGPVLVLDQVTDPRNIGAILRSAAAFGIAAVIVQDRHAPEETGALAKAASGALEVVPLLRAVNLSRTLVALKAAGLWVVGLDAASTPLRGGPLAQRRVALVLGAEGDGLRRLTRETCDEVAGLAMPGLMESLNVSAAAAVALYELTRGS